MHVSEIHVLPSFITPCLYFNKYTSFIQFVGVRLFKNNATSFFLKPYETFIRIHTRQRKETYMNSQDTIKQFIDTFDQLKKKTKRQLLEQRELIPIAATYVMRNHTKDQDRFFSIANTIKEQTETSSSLQA